MSKLETNTASLQEILAVVNALPDASTGTTYGGRILGWVTSATLEIHYIP